MRHKYGDLHLALAEIMTSFPKINGWFSIRLTGDPGNPDDPTHMTRLILEFGRYVNGTLLRQTFEIKPEHSSMVQYPHMGHAAFEMQAQFDSYCAQWALEHPVEVPIVQAG